MIRLLIAADVIMAAVFAWKFQQLPEQIPLFYSHPWGEPQIADYWYIVILPILMHTIILLNSYIVKKYLSEDNLFKKTFKIMNIFFIIIFTSIFLKIIFLVT